MKRFITFILFLTLLPLAGFAQNKRSESLKNWEYEVTSERVGVEGTKFIKVWGFGKNPEKAVLAAKRNAIHASLFRGLPAAENVNATPAICRDLGVIDTHADYFESFFQPGGPFLRFINVTTDVVPSGTDRRKVKGGYKVAIYVQVLYDDLKRQMESDGIIRNLSSGF